MLVSTILFFLIKQINLCIFNKGSWEFYVYLIISLKQLQATAGPFYLVVMACCKD